MPDVNFVCCGLESADGSDVEAAVPAPVSSDVGSEGAEEMEPHMEPQNKEQNELVEEQSDEEVVQDRTPLVEEEQPVAKDCQVDSSVEDPVAEDCTVDSSVEEPTDTVSSEEIQHSSEDKEMVPAEEVEITGDASVENEDAEEEPAVAEHIDSSVQEPLVDVQQCEAAEEVHLASEDAEMVPVDEVPEAAHTSDEATQEADHTSDADHDSEENEDCTVEDEIPVADDVDSSVQELPVEVQQCEATEEIQLASENCTVEEELPVAEDVQQCEATEDVHLAGEDTEKVHVNEVLQATLRSGEVTEEVHFTSDADEQNEVPTYEEMLQSAAKASEEKEDVAADEVTNNTDIHLAGEDTEMVHVNEVLQATLKSVEVTEEVHFTSDADEQNEVPTYEEMLQSAAKASEEKEDVTADEVTNNTDVAAEEETLLATDEMPQRPEAMDVGVVEVDTVDNLSQATITDDEGTVKESDFSFDLADVSVEEEGVVAADEMTQSPATLDEGVQDVLILENLSQATVQEVVSVDNLWQTTVTDDEGAAKQNGFTGDLMDVSVEEEGAVSADEMTQISATVDECVQEVLILENLSQATLTDDEGAVAADDMLHSTATKDENVEEVVTVENLSQATVTDDEWAVTLSAWLENLSRAKESGVTGDLQPAFNTARDFSDHIASPLSANVFEDATKSLPMDSTITVKPTVSEPADVPLCVYSRSDRKMKITEPMSVQVKIAKKPEALGSFSRRRLKMKLKADDVPLCIYSNRGDENNTSESQESGALGSLSLRKLRTEFNEIVAVAQENDVKQGKKSSVPLDALSLRQLRLKLKETLNAQKNKEPTRVPLGRLDENAY